MTFNWRAFRKWAFVDPWPAWLAGTVLAATVTLCLWRIPEPADAMRGAGFVLQVAGLGTVAYGLHEVRKLFRRPSAWARVVRWAQRFPTLFRPARQASGVGTVSGLGSATGIGSVNIRVSPDASLEQRLDWLEQRVQRLQEESREAHKRLKEEIRSVAGRVDQERKERLESVGEIKEKLESLAVGGLHLEALGLIWLFAGILLGTLPAETARLLTRFF